MPGGMHARGTVRRVGGDDSEGNIIHSGVIRSKQ